MTNQNEMPGQAAVAAVPAPAPKGLSSPGNADDALNKNDHMPRKQTLVERFLHNLRLALAVPHT